MSEGSYSGWCSGFNNVIIRVPQSTSWPDEHWSTSLPDALGAWQMAVSIVSKDLVVCFGFLLGPFKAVPAKLIVREGPNIRAEMKLRNHWEKKTGGKILWKDTIQTGEEGIDTIGCLSVKLPAIPFSIHSGHLNSSPGSHSPIQLLGMIKKKPPSRQTQLLDFTCPLAKHPGAGPNQPNSPCQPHPPRVSLVTSAEGNESPLLYHHSSKKPRPG